MITNEYSIKSNVLKTLKVELLLINIIKSLHEVKKILFFYLIL